MSFISNSMNLNSVFLSTTILIKRVNYSQIHKRSHIMLKLENILCSMNTKMAV